VLAVAGRQERDAMARQPPGGDLRGGVVGEPRAAIELGPVVCDQERKRLVVVAVLGRPECAKSL
jgi:hypothetical protein